jgi:hypothetical protein
MKLSQAYLKTIGFKENKKDNINSFEFRAAPNVLIVVMLGGSVDVIYIFTIEQEINELLSVKTKLEYVEIMAANKSAIKPFATKEDVEAAIGIIKRQIAQQKK